MALAEKISEYFWWHSIDLGNGIVTPGQKTLAMMKDEADLLFRNVDLREKSLLDVGAWNGGFSVEAFRRGARQITGLDHYTWNEPGFRGRETFDLVNSTLGANFGAVDIDLDAPQLSLKHLGQFDIVLFSGVFYHLLDPVAATREVAALARECLIVETHVENTDDDRPLMVFYPGTELAGDPTNWWGPNSACVVALLKEFGFPRVYTFPSGHDNRKVFHAYRN